MIELYFYLHYIASTNVINKLNEFEIQTEQNWMQQLRSVVENGEF